MPWTCSIYFNTNRPRVGSVTATWTDPGFLETFTFARDQVNTDDIAQFKIDANTARDAWVAVRTTIKSREVALTTFLNTP